jgi:hypothetical protein
VRPVVRRAAIFRLQFVAAGRARQLSKNSRPAKEGIVMAFSRTDTLSRTKWHVLRLAALSLGLLFQTPLFAFTLNVTNPDGTPIVGGFRWVLEEDTSYRQTPGTWIAPTAPEADKATVQSFNFYKSHMPVRGSGSTDAATAEVTVPETGKHYFVSVLAKDANYQMSGRPVAPDATGAYPPATVVLYSGPVPTAQIFVVAHRDNNPINNVFDQAQETGIGGFTVKIDDTVDLVKQDVFGNMLGTVYARDAAGNPIFNADGSPRIRCQGNGVIHTITQADVNAANGGAFCRNPYNLAVGEALVKNLHPGKYGVRMVPPTGSAWQQTATIEGTKTVDAWVKANEPPYFAEFGAGVWHATFGYVQPFNALPRGSTGTITGTVVNMRMSRPPQYLFSPGHPLENCWVGLNEQLDGGIPGRGLFAAPCEAGAKFTITGVEAGKTYQLVMFDKYLDNIFGFHTVVVPPSGTVDLGEVPVFRWFGAHDHYVFYDANENGVRDEGEPGIPEQAVNLRYRDGSIYQSFPTDMDGYVPFDEVFPFFFWQVAEVDFARYKATGVTVTVDAGGAVDAGLGEGKMTPQIQEGGVLQRTERSADVGGPVLLEGFQSFLGTTNRFEWGKKEYAAGENGGISGIVHYATTRAENDPRLTGAEDWEPGIPRVQVNLYQDAGSGAIADVNNEPGIQLADVDNYPLGWAEGGAKGPEDLDRNGNDVFDAGDAINIVHTDSWDDKVPTGCPAGNDPGAAADPFYQGGKCYDGQRNYNQVRPALFDGGYAFLDYYPGGVTSGSTPVALIPGSYIVEAATPPGYIHQKEEDKNVDFGDSYTPSPLLIPAACANWDDADGDGVRGRKVPASLSLFPGVDAPFAGQNRPQCDRKQVLLADRQNAAADFFMFTEVPITGHIQGFVLNDLANEFDVNSPNFGEKQAMPFLPVSIRDWTGREVNRVYTDQYGSYNGLVPGSFTMNRPSPSGVSQSMHQICVNDPGPIPDPANPANKITDPYFSRQYTQFCYTLNFLSGRVTFLDTPVLPIAAFANLGINPVDSEFPDHTPVIHSVDNALATIGGPYVPNRLAVSDALRTIVITSVGTVEVANPAFTISGNEAGSNPQPRTIPRDFGFGTAQGTVRMGDITLAISSWTEGSITAVVPQGTDAGGYQLSVTRGDNSRSSIMGVTVTVGGTQVVNVPQGGSIQAAIDSAPANALVLVPPGNYDEMVIMYKPVRLQGWGAGSTVINATLTPTEKTQLWRRKMSQLIASNQVTLLPDQGDPLQDPEAFLGSEGAPVFVIGRQNGATAFNTNRRARIDGFTVTGSNGSGGIAVNGYARFLTISNNRVINNQGLYGGGIRIGHPLIDPPLGPNVSLNPNVTIHSNQVCENGTLQTPGGGIAIYAGSTAYEIRDNWVCANFAQGDGGGIAHYGRSQNGRIASNKILFNQTFEQTAGVGGAGGGIFIAGAPVLTGLTQGSGNVTVEGNLIQGNNAGTGDGAGIATRNVNGADVNGSWMNPDNWHRINVFDNIIVNNVTGLAGGGIALHDTLSARVLQNTIAHNDSTATAMAAFGGCATASPNQSCPQPAGVISRANSAALETVLNNVPNRANRGRYYSRFSDPLFDNNIVWQNRSFYYSQDPTAAVPPVPGSQLVGQLLPDAATPVFNDLAVLGVAGQLNPRYSVLTSIAGYDDPSSFNVSADPGFMDAYFNGDRGQSIIQPEFTTSLTVRAALDEGGNFLDVRYGPLALTGDYHVNGGSAAANIGNPAYITLGASYIAELTTDFDVATRAACPDAGADEAVSGGTCQAVATAGVGPASTAANRPLALSVSSFLVSAHGAGGAALDAVAVRTPTAKGGTVALNDDRTVMTYTPPTNWTGTDTVVAVVKVGGELRTTTAAVTVTANTEVAGDSAGSASAPRADGGGVNDVVAGAESTPATVTSGDMRAYVPAPDSTLLAKAATSEETAELANEAPIANDDELVVREFDAEKGYYVFAGHDVLDNDADAEGESLKPQLVDNVKEGSVKLASDGSFTWTPAKKGALPKGPLSFTYRVSDGKKTSEVAKVTFTIEKAAKPTPAAQKAEPARAEPSKAEPKANGGTPARDAAAPEKGRGEGKAASPAALKTSQATQQ